VISSKASRLRRVALTVLGTATVLSASLLAPSAQAVPGDNKGEVSISVVDSAGQPLKAQVVLVRPNGQSGQSSPTGVNTYTTTVEVVRYGIVAMAPWGGIFCAGVTPCSYYTFSGTGTTVPGVIDVADVETLSTYTLQAPAPATVTGGTTPGTTRTVTLSPEMQQLASLAGQYGGLQTEWLRDGAVIPGTAASSYTLTAEDVGHTVAPRLSYAPLMAGLFTSQMGTDAAPLTLPGQVVGKNATRTTAEVFRDKVRAGKSTGMRVDVTSVLGDPTGQVRITIGTWKATKTLRNGSARLPLPKSFKPGRYKLVATYMGSATHDGSKGTDSFAVVKKK
jgi:hypothetical protein